LNLEYPFSTLHSSITPTEQVFVRAHFKTPHLSRDEWRLTRGGNVERELAFNYEELTSLPSQTVVATIECAGNGRVFLTPKAEGIHWELGAVGTASWTAPQVANRPEVLLTYRTARSSPLSMGSPSASSCPVGTVWRRCNGSTTSKNVAKMIREQTPKVLTAPIRRAAIAQAATQVSMLQSNLHQIG
jgi:hypothetical protein